MAVLVALGYGLGLELLQGALPVRRFEAVDLLANAVGVAVGVAAWWLRERSRPGRPG